MPMPAGAWVGRDGLAMLEGRDGPLPVNHIDQETGRVFEANPAPASRLRTVLDGGAQLRGQLEEVRGARRAQAETQRRGSGTELRDVHVVGSVATPHVQRILRARRAAHTEVEQKSLHQLEIRCRVTDEGDVFYGDHARLS